jgi:hypothetical protein
MRNACNNLVGKKPEGRQIRMPKKRKTKAWSVIFERELWSSGL